VVGLEEAQEVVGEEGEEALVSLQRSCSQQLFNRISGTLRGIQSNIQKATEATEEGEAAVVEEAVEHLVEEVVREEAGAEAFKKVQEVVRKWSLFVLNDLTTQSQFTNAWQGCASTCRCLRRSWERRLAGHEEFNSW
jgi:hypothetical protein